MSSDRDQGKLLVSTCLLAGKTMIENGSEMNRVNRMVKVIADGAGASGFQSYATLTGMIVSLGNDRDTQVVTIDHRAFNLAKVAIVNDYSRRFRYHQITLRQFHRRLVKLNRLDNLFPFWVQLLGSAVVSGTMEVVFRANLFNFWVTCMIGAAAWVVFYVVNRCTSVQFVSEFSAALSIGIMSVLAVKLHLGSNVDDIVIGGVMPLVPGVPIVNSVRDMLTGNLISGPARGIEAIMISCALGSGVALALKLL